LGEPLGKAKQLLWVNIIDFVNDIWLSIQVIFEKIELIKQVTEAIKNVKEELGETPEKAMIFIQFLNSKNKYELQELDILDRIGTILEVKRVLAKINLMLNLEDECQTMQLVVDRFMTKFELLREKGLPSPLVVNDKLTTQEDYNKKIGEVAKEQENTSSMSGIPTSRVLYETFENLFYLQYEVKQLFITNPTFSKYIEADEI